MDALSDISLQGGCPCGFIRYRVDGKPLIVHCCHCKWCQRETGSAFVINALFERNRVIHLTAEPVVISTPSESGKGQNIARCPRCYVAVWSNYSGGGPAIRFVRVGTLDQPHEFSPDVHIYVASKVPWVKIPDGAPIFDQYYDVAEVWGKKTDERRYAVLSEIRATKASEAETREARPASRGEGTGPEAPLSG